MGSKKITKCLMAVYLLLLTWIIIFKLQISPGSLPHIRNINLIPFEASVIVNGKTDFDEIINNALVFVPFGVFMGMLWEEKFFIRRIIPVFLTSLLFETVQYVFGIGASDITDLLMNTLGGVTGLGCYALLSIIWKGKTNKILNCICLAGLILVLLFIGLVLFMTMP